MRYGYKLSAEGFAPKELVRRRSSPRHPDSISWRSATTTTRGSARRGTRRSRGPHLEAVRAYEQAGYDHVVLANNGPDPDRFVDFFARELKPALAR